MKYKLSVLVLAAVLAGCGGGSSSTASGPTTLSGAVIDGYIKGAKVCLDLNNNFACDADEPSTTTGDKGAYSFDYTGSVVGKQVLAEVTVGATDEDLGAITAPYNLLTPAENPAVVTPLTTLVSHEMIATGASMADSAQTVKTNFNFQNDPVGYNFIEKKDTTAAVVAQAVAASIATLNDKFKNDATASSNLKPAEMMKAAIVQVKEKILPNLIKADGSVDLGTCPQTPCKQSDLISAINTKAASQITSITGNIQAIVSQTKSGDGTVVNLVDSFADGIVLIRKTTQAYLKGTTVVDPTDYNIEADYLVKASNGEITESQQIYVNSENKWYPKYQSSEIVHYLDGSSWKSLTKQGGALSDSTSEGKLVASNNCVTWTRTGASAPEKTFCATRKDLAGKKVGEVFPGICKKTNSNELISGCSESTPLPAGSYGFEVGVTNNIEGYVIWSDDWDGYNYTDKPYPTTVQNPGSPTLAKFLEATKTDPQWKGHNCGLGFRVKSQSADKLTGVIEWGVNTKNDCNSPTVSSYVETSNYTLSTVGGKEVVTFGVPSIYRQKYPGDMDGSCQFLFAVVPNSNNIAGIHNGDYCPKNTRSTQPFTGDIDNGQQAVSKILAVFLMELRKMAAFPY